MIKFYRIFPNILLRSYSLPMLSRCRRDVYEIKMDDNQSKMINHLVEIEQVAEDIMTDRQQIVQLDKRRNKNREAIRFE